MGNKVLKGQKATKALMPYNQEHYTITEIRGTQIQAVQREEVGRRDPKKWKKALIFNNAKKTQEEQDARGKYCQTSGRLAELQKQVDEVVEALRWQA